MQINSLYAFRRLDHYNLALDVFFKNAEMIVFCHYHKLDYSQKHPKTLGKSFMKKDVVLKVSREEYKNMNMQQK